jgi:very-short-patch-repair endonuclease
MSAEAEVARIAARQHGMVTWAQMMSAGVSRDAVATHVRNGWLVPRHRGVHQLGVFGGAFGDEMAALLACGPYAVLSHWTAAWVFALCIRSGRLIEVTTTLGLSGRRPGIRSHRSTTLPSCDVVVKHGLRVTTPARTLLDLSVVASRDKLERLIEEAQVQKLASTAELLAVAGRASAKRGVKRFRELVDLLDEPLFTRSEAERRLIALCRSAQLPLPRTNVHRAGWEVDAVWDAQRLVVEVDGRKFHSPQSKFERDRRKDADLMLAGFRVLRLTWHRLTREPEQVIAIIAAALRQ